MFFFNNEQRAREDFRRIGQEQNARAIRVANSAANRGVTSPAALAMGASQASAAQRAALAPLQAQMLAQGRQQDQQNVQQLVGGLLGVGGTILGGAVGGPMGAQAGGSVGRALPQLATAGQSAPKPADPLGQGGSFQGVLGNLDQQFGAPQPPPAQQDTYQPARVPQISLPAANQMTFPQPQGAAGVFGDQIDPAWFASMAGMAPPLSDEESKRDIEDASRAIDQYLRAVQPSSFNYRDPNQPGARPGRQTGVMAQDLERDPVGRQMVRRGPDGMRHIDPQAALANLLAVQARLGQRLDHLENRSPGGRMGAVHQAEDRRERVARAAEAQPQLPPGHPGAPGQAAFRRSVGPSIRSMTDPVDPSGRQFLDAQQRAAETDIRSQQAADAVIRQRHAQRALQSGLAPQRPALPQGPAQPSILTQAYNQAANFLGFGPQQGGVQRGRILPVREHTADLRPPMARGPLPQGVDVPAGMAVRNHFLDARRPR